MGIMFDTAPWKDQSLFFWKFVLRETLHSAKLGMFTDKSVVSFLNRVKVNVVKEGWLQCRKDYGVYLQKDGKVFVFYPSSFPWNKKATFNVEGQALNYDMDTKVGPWVVCAEIVSDKGDCPEKFRLTQNAIISMEAFMEGNIEYYVESPTWRIDCKFQPRPLVFCVFKKADRPMAWKNSNLKIQSTLPLVGNDAIATGALQTPQTYEGKPNPTRLVRVVIRLQR